MQAHNSRYQLEQEAKDRKMQLEKGRQVNGPDGGSVKEEETKTPVVNDSVVDKHEQDVLNSLKSNETMIDTL